MARNFNSPSTHSYNHNVPLREATSLNFPISRIDPFREIGNCSVLFLWCLHVTFCYCNWSLIKYHAAQVLQIKFGLYFLRGPGYLTLNEDYMKVNFSLMIFYQIASDSFQQNCYTKPKVSIFVSADKSGQRKRFLRLAHVKYRGEWAIADIG